MKTRESDSDTSRRLEALENAVQALAATVGILSRRLELLESERPVVGEGQFRAELGPDVSASVQPVLTPAHGRPAVSMATQSARRSQR